MRGQWVFAAMSVLFAAISTPASSFFYLPFGAFLALLFFLQANRKTKTAVIAIFSFASMFIYFQWYDHSNVTKYRQGDFTTVGRFVSIPHIDGDQITFTLQTKDQEKLMARYTFQSKAEKRNGYNWKPGYVCHFSGDLERPKKNTNEHAFNYQQYLFYQHIHWIFEITSINHCTYEPKLTDSIHHYRQKIIGWLDDHFPEETAGFVKALTVGDQESIPQEDLEVYRQLGIVHLLSISGLHVGIVIFVLYRILVRIGISREQTIFIVLLFLPVYAVFTGGAPPVVRAALMAGFLLIGRLFKKPVPPEDAISLSFLLMVWFRPYDIFHIGFQLSYVVTFALIASERIFKKCENPFSSLATVSLIAQASSLPLICYYFHQFSLLSIVMNILFVPLYSFIFLPFVLITLIVSVIPNQLSSLFTLLLHWMFSYSAKLAHFCAEFDVFVITTGKLPFSVMILLCLIILFLFMQMEQKPIVQWWRSMLAAICGTAFLFLAVKMIQPGEVTVLDVGQGDSIFIKEPGLGKSYLIDTGGAVSFEKESWQEEKEQYSIGRQVLIPYFRSKGINEIDVLFLTHGDYDHIGEAIAIIRNFRINKIVIPANFMRDELERKILYEAQKRGIDIYEAEAGDVVNGFHILSPTAQSDSKNDGSLVLLAEFGGMKWLFTGDLEEQGEKALLETFPNLTADVLKIGHHGSKTSTSEPFLKTVKPTYGIISAGRKNRFGHPHKEVIERLKKNRVHILRTDQMGAVQFKFRGKRGGTFLFYPPYDTL